VKVIVALSIVLLLAACATTPAPRDPDGLFRDHLFDPPSVSVDAADVFAVSAEMRRYIDTEIAGLVRRSGRQRGLVEALYDRAHLKLEYDGAMTRNAAEAFAARSGNCLSLVIMSAAFAKELGLQVRYQKVFTDETWSRSGDVYMSVGHVNLSLARRQVEKQFGRNEGDDMTIDFLPSSNVAASRTWAIDEATIVAMYMNNRAVESLVSDQVNDAYWWARAAVQEQPRFLSAYNTLAVVYQRHGNLAEAQLALEQVLEQEPANTLALANLAVVLRGRGNAVASQEVARRLERLQPNPPFAYFHRGLDAMRNGEYGLAKEMFAKEVDRAAYYHEFHFWLALAHVGLGELEPARKHMAIAIENSPMNRDRDLYASKLARLQATVPVIRR